jgi:hypothetical protein
MSKWSPSCALAVCLVVCTQFSQAQEVRASLGGKVTDASGSLVPNAEILVVSDDTNVTQRTSTNVQGNWIVQFLLPGHYHFSVAAAGFKMAQHGGITLQTADSKTIDVQLEVGAATQTVEVTAEAPLIDTTSAISGTVITTQQMTEMPSFSRIPTLSDGRQAAPSACPPRAEPRHTTGIFSSSIRTTS